MRAGQITSFSAIDDRFDYSRKGIFRCKYRNENAYVALVILGVVLVTMFIWGFSMFADANLASVVFTLIFDVLKIASVIAAPLSLVALIRMVRSGQEYRFNAGKEKMLITCPAANHRSDIFYDNVSAVQYYPFNTASNPRGYNVIISCKDGSSFSYCYLFPPNCPHKDPDITPFRIIEEHVGLIERPEYIAGQRIDII